MSDDIKTRKIVIEVSEKSAKLAPESEHASIFELIAVLQALMQTFNTKKE
jgi:hypothetical protein